MKAFLEKNVGLENGVRSAINDKLMFSIFFFLSLRTLVFPVCLCQTKYIGKTNGTIAVVKQHLTLVSLVVLTEYMTILSLNLC